jgi:ankyrin repeat protein
MRGADSIVKYLVEQGAKLDAKNKAGLTPLDIAMGKRPASPIGGGSLAPAHESTVALIKQLMESNPVAKNADQ